VRIARSSHKRNELPNREAKEWGRTDDQIPKHEGMTDDEIPKDEGMTNDEIPKHEGMTTNDEIPKDEGEMTKEVPDDPDAIQVLFVLPFFVLPSCLGIWSSVIPSCLGIWSSVIPFGYLAIHHFSAR